LRIKSLPKKFFYAPLIFLNALKKFLGMALWVGKCPHFFLKASNFFWDKRQKLSRLEPIFLKAPDFFGQSAKNLQ
jgi:hypothetical protein